MKYLLLFQLGNHDTHRIASKVGVEKIDGLNILTAFLPGIRVTYQGEEIGMIDGEVKCQDGNDLNDDCTIYSKVTRDFERTPFQWSSGKNAGFSKGDKTWLPVAKNFETLNVDVQNKKFSSHLTVYRVLQTIREILKTNATNTLTVVRHDDDYLLHLSRGSKSNFVFDYLFNLDGKNKTVSLQSKSKIQPLAVSGSNKKLT